jgi:hypothetical protein
MAVCRGSTTQGYSPPWALCTEVAQARESWLRSPPSYDTTWGWSTPGRGGYSTCPRNRRGLCGLCGGLHA